MTSVLISGASVAGPVLTFWLRRAGVEVTVVERAATALTLPDVPMSIDASATTSSDQLG